VKRKAPRTSEDLRGGLFATVPTDEEGTASWRTIRPVIDLAKCTRCNVCWKFCPDVAIGLDGEGFPYVKMDFCKGCGICEHECAPRAIAMVREE